MKIIVSQQGKKLNVEFFCSDVRLQRSRSPDFSVGIDKAEDFLVAIDKFVKKRKIKSIGQIGQVGFIEFVNTGVLTERIIRATITGLRF